MTFFGLRKTLTFVAYDKFFNYNANFVYRVFQNKHDKKIFLNRKMNEI